MISCDFVIRMVSHWRLCCAYIFGRYEEMKKKKRKERKRRKGKRKKKENGKDKKR